jgi:hypothetical protein
MAPACPLLPPPSTVHHTSNMPAVSDLMKGSVTSCVGIFVWVCVWDGVFVGVEGMVEKTLMRNDASTCQQCQQIRFFFSNGTQFTYSYLNLSKKMNKQTIKLRVRKKKKMKPQQVLLF